MPAKGVNSTRGDWRNTTNDLTCGSHDDAAALSAAAEREPAPSDQDLLRHIAADDDAALRVFYSRYSGLVYSLAWRMLCDETRAEEVLQETFIRIWRAAITYDPQRGRPETWVATIARNLALTALRKQRPVSLEDHQHEVDAIADDRDDPEHAVWMTAQQQMVREAVAMLPVHQRRVVLLAYFEGLTHTEIAERTGEPLGTVKSRLRLALRKLESILRATGGDGWDEMLHEVPSTMG